MDTDVLYVIEKLKNTRLRENKMCRYSNCYRCGYFREEERPNKSIRNYCNDLDCTVDPYDPACNYHE